jgi:hypothetical protein
MSKQFHATIAITLAIICNTLAANVPQAERDALMALYNGTDGVNWINNTNWTVGDPCTNNWHGVECDEVNTSILGLGLSANNLEGMIPAALGDLSNLQDIFFFTNQLTGTIPTDPVSKQASWQVLS